MTHNYLERLFTKKCDKKLITGMPRQEAHNNSYLETDSRRQRTNTTGEVHPKGCGLSASWIKP